MPLRNAVPTRNNLMNTRPNFFLQFMTLPRQTAPDRTWIARIRAGDASALDTVFRSYYAELCAFAYRYVRSRAQAEDLVHDVFAQIWAEREQWQVRDHLKAYLYSAVRNRAVSALRRQTVERRWEDRVHHGAPVHSENPAQGQLEREDLARVVAEVLARLPERCRMAVKLRWQRQLSYSEIAETMGISVNTVEVHITRACRAVRERYAALQSEPPS
jgi:RNA polymerase sigma-70 factor, ECF subfamily